MTDAPDPLHFDLMEALEGRNYPTDEVSVFLDEAAANEIGRLRTAASKQFGMEEFDALKDTEAAIGELIERAKASEYVFHIQGAPRKSYRAIGEATEAKFPIKRNMLGQPEEDAARDEYYITKLWVLLVKKIVKVSSGAEQIAPPEESLVQFREMAPMVAIKIIDDAIQKMAADTAVGYEQVIQGQDFLSKPSVEG